MLFRSGIADMLLTKQVGDYLRLLLAPIQMAAYDGDEFGTSTGGVYYGRRSHIKGSVNLAAMTTVNENNAYKSAEELRRWFAETLSKPAVINYCGGGIAATADTLVLPMLGHNNVRLYDASLSEWARDAALPMQM